MPEEEQPRPGDIEHADHEVQTNQGVLTVRGANIHKHYGSLEHWVRDHHETIQAAAKVAGMALSTLFIIGAIINEFKE